MKRQGYPALLVLALALSFFSQPSMGADDAPSPFIDGPENQEIRVTIKNNTSARIYFMFTDPLEALGPIPADYRWISKCYQWGTSYCSGDVSALGIGDEIAHTVDSKKVLAFYRVDPSRCVGNLQQGAAFMTAASGLCAGVWGLQPSVAAVGAVGAKNAINGMKRPGERILLKDIPTGSTIVLTDPPAANQDQEAECQAEGGRCLVITIQPPVPVTAPIQIDPPD
jgi:hypothetical protein